MLFNTLSVFGLVAIASAAPHLHSRQSKGISAREVGSPAARGLTWKPTRSLSARSSNYVSNFGSSFDQTIIIQEQTITILQLSSSQQLQEQQLLLQAELQLVQAIQEQLLIEQQFQFAVDNIRINTFLNANQNVNTVAIIVTQVVDSRDSNNINTRYMVRQVQSRPSVSEQVFVLINEQSSMTINSLVPSATFDAVTPTSTASVNSFAAPQFGSYTPGGNVSLQAQGINLLPLGVAPPSFDNARGFVDPALIIQPNQGLFVDVVGNSEQFVVVVV